MEDEKKNAECLRIEGRRKFLKLICPTGVFIDENHKKADGTEVEPLPKWFL